jgi:hypothetical protein
VTRTEAGVVKGKLAYMAPEQCRGEEIDARADVFSLGVCLYETLTSKPLYHRPSDFETMKAVLDEPVPSVRVHVPTIPETLDAIVQRCLAKSPAERWQSAGELAEALDGWLAAEKERVGSARIAELLARLFRDEIARGPQLQASSPSASGTLDAISASMAGRLVHATSGQARVVGASRSPHAATPITQQAPAPTRARGAMVALLAVLALSTLVLVVGAGGGLWWWLHQPVITVQRDSQRGSVPPVGPGPVGSVPPVEPGLAGAAHFESTPPGATVSVDGVEVPGTTPVTVGDLPLGVHSVEMRRGTDAPWTGQMLVEDGVEAHVVGTFAAAAQHHERVAMGSLAINTRPWSKVYVGSRLLGTTPIGNADVPAGDVTLRLVDRDGETHRVHVHVQPGQRATAFFDLAQP